MKKILIIEDEVAVLENIAELLESENYSVSGAENGFKGIELAKSMHPDLIVCDIMMPQMDGFTVLKELQKDRHTSTIPFVFLSAKAEKNDIRYGMELGADDFLAKPFTPEELFIAVRARLQKHEKFEIESENRLIELRCNLANSLPHELRTPLNGILGTIQLLLRYYDSMERDEVEQLHETIYSSAKRLHKLILNYLVYSEVEMLYTDVNQRTKLKQTLTPDSGDYIFEIFRDASMNYERENDLNLDIMNVSVRILPDHFKKICEEIADNAFKFSITGTSIDVKSFIENDMFCMVVSDTGRSITQEQISRIGAYMQFDRNIYEQQGSGLGLIIVKRLTQIYDGSLVIESEKDNITKIKVKLPVATN